MAADERIHRLNRELCRHSLGPVTTNSNQIVASLPELSRAAARRSGQGMEPLRGARRPTHPLTAPIAVALRKLRLTSQRRCGNSIGTSEESSIGIDRCGCLRKAEPRGCREIARTQAG